MQYIFPYFAYASFIQSVFGSALVGVVGYLIVFHTRIFRQLADKPLSPTYMGVPSTIMALILAFMASSVWQNTAIATVALQNERLAIQRLYELPFGVQDIGSMRTKELDEYVSLVKEVEWGEYYNMIGIREVDDNLKRLRKIGWEADQKACGDGKTGDACQSSAVNAMYSNVLLNLEAAREQRLSLGSLAHFGYFGKWVIVHLLALATAVAIAVVHQAHRQAAIAGLTIFCISICLVFSMISLHIQPYKGPGALVPSLLTSRN